MRPLQAENKFCACGSAPLTIGRAA